MKRHSSLSDSLRLRCGRFLCRVTRRALGLSVTGNRIERRRRLARDRRGSTLLVVIALLGALTLLGLLFFTFASQEQQNAANFADAAKRPDNPGDNIENIIDESLRQLIVGGNPNQRNSALWMGRHSLVFNMFGQDLQPYSGTGVNLVFKPGTPRTEMIVDQNRDGVPDTAAANYDLREINDSPAARNFLRIVSAMPAADVDYTYPDHNNAFLAYDAYTWNFSTTPPTKMRVIKPSFHRSELLRDYPVVQANWFTDTGTTGRVFRPHPFHVYCPPTGVLPVAPLAFRFLVPADIDRNRNGIIDRDDIDLNGDGVIDPGDTDYNGNNMVDLVNDVDFNDNGVINPGDIDYNGNSLVDRADVDFNGNGVVDANDQALIDLLPGGSGGFPFIVDLPNSATVNPNGNGIPNQTSLWSLSSSMPVVGPYEFDVDNDDDGVMDSIWMDLDLSVRTRKSDNAKYLPLVAFKVVDLDSLINLNATGNLSGDTQNNATANFGNGADISLSSMGLSPAEINPIWALDTTPAEATSLRDHNNYFGYSPTDQRDLANMELWWLLKGRIEYSVPPQIHSGRFGDADRVGNVYSAAFGATPPVPIAVNNSTQSNLFPLPGVTSYEDLNRNGVLDMGEDTNVNGFLDPYDDNFDLNEGLQKTWLAGSTMAQTQVFVHPLALGGRGRFWNSANLKQLDLAPNLAGAGNPSTWLRYTGNGLGYDLASGTADTTWLNPFGGALVQNYLPGANGFNPLAASGGQWVDDPLEVMLEPKFIDRPTDDPFEPHDSLFLHMSKVDRDRTGITSRFANLMPANIVPGTTSNPNQAEVARRFTADSWDLKTFGLPRYQGGVGLDLQPGQAGVDDNGDGIVDDMNELGWPGSDDDRAWEFNVDFDGNGKLEFPPQFAGAAAYSATDPFRPQLRRLLSMEFGNTSQTRQPMRLSVNELLDFDRRTGVFTNTPITDPLLYRPLTPHSTDVTLMTLPAAGTVTAYPPTTQGAQEVWARRDRQKMARDIYVLLYTFCGGNDNSVMEVDVNGNGILEASEDLNGNGVRDISGNVTTQSGFLVHSYPMRRQMAQFAVNLVDALDPDNVITAFEFDHNLLNGWNLDDDFMTNESASMLPRERDVVFGVEAQELTISEVLWAGQAQQGTDHTLTPFDESTAEYNFLQIELQCVNPTALDLVKNASTALDKGIWRIHRDDNNNGRVDGNENAVEILKGTIVGSSPVPPSQLTPGQLYTIASSDQIKAPGVSQVSGAALYVDTSSALIPKTFELAAPNTSGPAFPSAPFTTQASLDLVHADHNGYFVFSNPADQLLSRTSKPAGTAAIIKLERRLNPYLVQLGLGTNPYHAVDLFRGTFEDLAIDASVMTQAAAATNLAAVQSQERRQPLDGFGVGASAGTGASALRSTLSLNNSNSPATFDLFHPHFDRDFASVVELFEIPLQRPAALPQEIINSRRPASLLPASGGQGQLEQGGPFTFGGAVLLPTEDRNHNGIFVPSEDLIGNGAPLGSTEDTIMVNGIFDPGEVDINGNGIVDTNSDTNGDTFLTFGNDLNNNGILDDLYEADSNNNGMLDLPEDLNNNGQFDVPLNPPNHFHRLLSLMEVPTRTHRQLGNPLQVNRVPGKINLNGIRDPRVLASLIDDRQVINSPERTGLDVNGNAVIEEGLLDATGDTARDWWYQFLIARDGQTLLNPLLPYNAATNPLLPPLPMSGVSRPFHDLGALQPVRFDERAKSSLEDTILRTLPISTNGRRLFELVTDAQLAANPANTVTSVEPILRHRVLSKIMGNTTTRSNVFVVYVTIGMFECVEQSSGAVRIGGQMDVDEDGQKDTHRAVFIIDRSQAEEAFDPATGTFDWKKLIKARQRIN